MTKKESRIFYILIAILLLTLLLEGIPGILNYYKSNLNDIDLLVKKTEHLDKILQKNKFWQEEYSKIKNAEEKKSIQLFSAKSRELVAAKLQSLLKSLARKNNVNIESTLLPEFKNNSRWIIISQNISIKGSAKNIFNFVQAIEKNNKKLIITHTKLRSNRKQLRGSISVAGFSQELTKAESL